MGTVGKTAAGRRSASSRSTAARRKGNAAPLGAAMSPAASLRHDLLLLLLGAASLYFALAVYIPQLVRPAGPYVHGALYAALGAGMWFLPLTALLTAPLLAVSVAWRPLLWRAFNWSWALALLTALTAGLWPDRGWGGLLGDSCATLGYRYLGAFYPVLVALLAILAVLRLGGRGLIFPFFRGLWKAATVTGDAAAKLGGAVQEQASAHAERIREARARAEAFREERRQAVLAAELEAADAADGSSALIRDTDDPAPSGPPPPTPAISPVTAKGRRRKGPPEVVALEAEGYDDDADFAAALSAAAGVPVIRPLGSAPGENLDGRSSEVPRITPLMDGSSGAAVPGCPEGAEATPAARKTKTAGRDACATEPTGRGPEVGAEDDSAALAGQALSLHQSQPEVLGEGQLRLFASTQAGYELPPLELLRDAPLVAGEEEHLAPRAATIERTLRSFNIDAKCVDAVVGPRVTRYELTIGPGINVSKVHALSDNLALELAVKSVRIEAPIPGKRAIGIEVPNAAPQLVTLRSILGTPLMQRSNHPLTVAIGRDIAGHPVIANLAKMPHLLVAGATGSGKSVCLNTLIVSLLMRNAPDTLRMILIDPKRVELTSYEDVPHLACPVVCDVNQAQSALKWVVAEMDRRYRLLQKRRARNIAAFNETADPAERLPFIVVVLDELADLMMLAGQTVEKLIARITQLSRAVGIHMVIATQRPDVKVITGTIKANVPSRIAFAVVSHIDSRTILDGAGAEKLLGGGDMLFNPIGETVPLRVQGCFLADDEIDRVVGHCREQAQALLDESILSFGLAADGSVGAAHEVPTLELDGSVASSSGDTPVADLDPLFEEAKAIVNETQRASTSYLQRRLRIGYNRAARIMEELQDAGIVSEPDDRGDRRVL
jgi:DNA segregation ATPase FtsK/SpoIIIE-like protein